MTISTTATKVVVAGNGAQTTFNYSFPIPAAAEASLYLADVSAGSLTLLPASAWSITGVGTATGGTFTYPLSGAPITALQRLVLARNVPETQIAALTNQSGFQPAAIEGGLDRIVMMIQEHAEQLGRGLKAPINEPSLADIPPASVRAGRFLAFDTSPDANPVAASLLGGSTPVTPFMAGVLSSGDAAAAQTALAVAPAVFAAPIGTGGGVVPADIRARFRNVANAKTDFGIQLYEADGTTLRDNTTRLQAAIDAVQAYGGAIFFPNEGAQTILTNGTTLRETGVWNRMPLALIGEGCWDTTRGLRNSFVGPPTQFALGPGLKLINNATGPLITSPPNAGMLTIERMTLDGNSAFQPTPRRVIDFVDAPAVSYAFSGNLTEVSVTNTVAEGIFVGVNRSMGRFVDTWVQYCGALGGAAAWNIRTYDIQVERPGVGNNPGIGIFLGNSAQFEMIGGALWNNDKHLVVAADTLSFVITGVHFDAATGTQVEIARYTADSRPPMRKLVGCYFSRRDFGASGTVPYVDGSADDIVSGCDALTLIGCSWIGRASGSGNRRSRYNLNMNSVSAKTMVLEDAKGGVSNTLGFTNAPAQIWRWGDMSAATPGYRIDGDVTVRTINDFSAIFLRAQDGTFVTALGSGAVGGKEGSLRLWDSAGNVALRLSAGTGIGRSFINTAVAPEFVNEAAAAAGGLAIGDLFFNTTTNAYTKRRV